MSTECSDVILSKIIGHLVEMFEGLNKFISGRYDRLVTGGRQRAASL